MTQNKDTSKAQGGLMLHAWHVHDRIAWRMVFRFLKRIRFGPVLRKETPRMIYAAFNIIGIIIGIWATLLVCVKGNE
jgi:hypothetical protein